MNATPKGYVARVVMKPLNASAAFVVFTMFAVQVRQAHAESGSFSVVVLNPRCGALLNDDFSLMVDFFSDAAARITAWRLTGAAAGDARIDSCDEASRSRSAGLAGTEFAVGVSLSSVGLSDLLLRLQAVPAENQRRTLTIEQKVPANAVKIVGLFPSLMRALADSMLASGAVDLVPTVAGPVVDTAPRREATSSAGAIPPVNPVSDSGSSSRTHLSDQPRQSYARYKSAKKNFYMYFDAFNLEGNIDVTGTPGFRASLLTMEVGFRWFMLGATVFKGEVARDEYDVTGFFPLTFTIPLVALPVWENSAQGLFFETDVWWDGNVSSRLGWNWPFFGVHASIEYTKNFRLSIGACAYLGTYMML